VPAGISGSANFPSAAAVAEYSRLPAVECSLTTARLTGFPAPSRTVPFHAAPETATATGTISKTLHSHKIEFLFQRLHTVWNYNGHLARQSAPNSGRFRKRNLGHCVQNHRQRRIRSIETAPRQRSPNLLGGVPRNSGTGNYKGAPSARFCAVHNPQRSSW